MRPDGVPSRTRVQVLHRGEGWAWVEARPETGRLHQIRVHLRAVGLPILGDKVYGRDRAVLPEVRPGRAAHARRSAPASALPRQALHAYQLTFDAPATGEPLDADGAAPRRPRAGARRARPRSDARAARDRAPERGRRTAVAARTLSGRRVGVIVLLAERAAQLGVLEHRILHATERALGRIVSVAPSRRPPAGR